ncbi:MAG: Ig-like domain-containing protein [candidate division Zixibacteria bacterium]|nr:Ig-like domain-containing protein [candidate division Zixibacteria bacterium]
MCIKKLEIFFIILLLWLLGCAKKGFPPGGPEDLTPPGLLEVFPADNSTGVDTATTIALTFSEIMDKESVEKSIFLTPVPRTPPEFKWKKNKLILSTSQVLEKNRTYVITIGTNAKDLHNNKMEKSHSFAFSTGTKLDSGFISGRVFFKSSPEKGVSIWCYSVVKEIESGFGYPEPDPKREKPIYVTLSGENGEYRLSYLAEGKYRLFAVKDLNGDLLWDPDKELLGITTQDLNLTEDSLFFTFIDFTLAFRDTTPAALLDCQSLDINKIRLDFSEPLSYKLGLYDKNNYRIVSDSLEEEILEIRQVYTKEEDYQKVYLVTEEIRKNRYRIQIENLFDSMGNPVDEKQKECIFEGAEQEDKAPLQIISSYPQPGAVDIPLDFKIKLYFDKPPEKNLVEEKFLLEDSSAKKVEGKFLWENPAVVVFQPDKLLQRSMKYLLSIRDIVDLWRNFLADSSFRITFSTLNPDTLGSISGKVESLSNRRFKAVIILERFHTPFMRYEKRIDEPGDFKFEYIFPGKYRLSAYQDLNDNGTLDSGNIYPFEPAEPQLFYPDSLNVRPRWETEGVILKFR